MLPESNHHSISLYFSGNLPATTLDLIIKSIQCRTDVSLKFLSNNDIFDREIRERYTLHNLSVSGVSEDILSDLLIISPRTPGDFEGVITAYFKENGAKVLSICTDIGGSADKYNRFPVLPDLIGIPDPFVKKEFLLSGIPTDLIAEYGSPYLDNWMKNRISPSTNGTKICFFEVPNEFDWCARKETVHYTEQTVVDELDWIFSRRSISFGYKNHPWNIANAHHVEKLPTFNHVSADLTQIFSTYNVAVSTYSTVLILARLAGVRAISYQPEPGPLRRENVFAHCGIPIARTKYELEDLIFVDYKCQEKQKPFWYNTNDSEKRLSDIIDSLL